MAIKKLNELVNCSNMIIMMMADGSEYDEDEFHISLIQFISCLWQTLKARQKNNTIMKCSLSYN